MFELEGWKYIEGAAQAGTLHLIGLLSDGGVHSRWAGGGRGGALTRCWGGVGWS